MNEAETTALALRKAKLRLDGAIYRIGAVEARTVVVDKLRAGLSIEKAIDQAVGVIGAGLEAVMSPAGSRIYALMPLAVAAFSYLSRRKLLTPVIVGGLATAAITLAVKHNRSSTAATHLSPDVNEAETGPVPRD